MFYVALAFSLTLTVTGARNMSLNSNAAKQREAQCAKDYFENFPNLRTHFSEEDAKRVCQHEAAWQRGAKMVKSAEQSNLTSKQLNWLKSLWSCKTPDCLCDSVRVCRVMLKMFRKMLKRQKPHQRKKRRVSFNHRINQEIKSFFIKKYLRMSMRKEIRMLTDTERQTYFRAVNKLKSEKIDNMSKYDVLVYFHRPEYSPGAHFCSSFLPFHREFLTIYELALRQVEPDVIGSPYWDSEMDASLPNAAHSVLWTDEFFGPGDGYVRSGPHGHWKTLPTPTDERLNSSSPILRLLGNDTTVGELLKTAGLFKAISIEEMMNKTEFSQLTHCIDPFFEFLHGTIHDWIGGHMTHIPAAVNDPVFFVYHSFVDHLWEIWRHKHQTREQRETDYPSDHGSCNSRTECYAGAQLKPFSIKVIEGLSNHYTDKLYTYSPRPTCDNETLNCGSEYLFCDATTIKCISKVKVGGNCTGFEAQDICYNSVCSNGVCIDHEDEESNNAIPPTTKASSDEFEQKTRNPSVSEHEKDHEIERTSDDPTSIIYDAQDLRKWE